MDSCSAPDRLDDLSVVDTVDVDPGDRRAEDEALDILEPRAQVCSSR